MSDSMVVQDYTIVSCKDLDDLESRVKDYISIGWTPVGGMQIEPPHDRLIRPMFHQTMVRYVPADEQDPFADDAETDAAPDRVTDSELHRLFRPE